MPSDYSFTQYIPRRILAAVLTACWLSLLAAAPAVAQHDHQEMQVDGTNRADTGNHDSGDEQKHQNGREHDEGHDDHEDVVQLTDAELKEFGIETRRAGPGALHTEFLVPGEVAVNYDRLAHIAPRFPGVVKQVNKHLGDEVHTGDVLVVLESNEGLVPYEVKSLLDGTVIEKHITIGEVHSEESPAFVIADLSDVWVNLSIYQMYLPYVREGQEVVISAGQELPEATGIISYLSPIVDEHTRTATARVVLENPKRQWRPGLFVEGRVRANKISVDILVPKSALQTFEGRTVVFAESEDGFIPQPVKVGRINGSSAEILSGLTTDQVYVSAGGFTLKAELEKSSMSGGHDH